MVGAGGNGSDIATFGSPRLDRLIDTGFLQIFLAGHIPTFQIQQTSGTGSKTSVTKFLSFIGKFGFIFNFDVHCLFNDRYTCVSNILWCLQRRL